MSPALGDWAAVVLAGGFGTRIRHLHPDVPKPMIPARGRPFLEWVVRYLRKQGLRDIVLSTGHLAGVVERHFKTQPVPGARTVCVAETTPLGTAGGFRYAARSSGLNPTGWVVLNGDSLVFSNLSEAVTSLNMANADGAMIGVPMTDASRFGTLLFAGDGKLLGFEEKRPGAGVINAGVYLLKSRLTSLLPAGDPQSFEKDVFPRWLAGGVRFHVSSVNSPFLDIGTPESLALAEDFIQQNERWFALG